jgi:ribosomal protein S18 acetylase RimI-like enzyme
MKHKIVQMKLDRHKELIDFWESIAGIWVSDDDSPENLKLFFKRNPKLNYMVLHKNKIIGTVKCSHDGRRGYLHHLAVKKEYRKQGIAAGLVNKCINELQKQGIKKFRVFVLDSNPDAIEFWKHMGFEEQVYDYRTLQKNV